ncbi:MULTISPECIES: hypothetical protein [Hydrocarboniphaga]|jgi:Tfp pilus assembly protein PilF|uniref:Type II/III secretion system secretin-like domain-containing protein n=1 Tax=Hydrocarboniphaga effusa AP103 TaxID=1172194 RepID=I7ZJ51_9GAMM|nr:MULTISPECIES: hypothetical protein [Hydrocarboniphaga]EIT71797.1 hypothetical protein WQQ_19340 [Hydrocarboniphaga effusa AP103]MDZ4080419.1 hypothetical protein [Hydrocarboniphaga sp.]
MPRLNPRKLRASLIRCAVFTTTLALSGCASNAARKTSNEPMSDWPLAERALRSGQWEQAQAPIARLLQQDLRNGQLQFLHALTEEGIGRERDRARLDLAAVGYANAERFAPGNYWALLQLGYIELERGNYRTAQSRFAEAVLDQPRRWEAFYGLGVASYYRRDLPLMRLAAERSFALAPEQRESIRLNAFALAVAGEPEAQAMTQKLVATGDDADARYAMRRVAEYLEVAPAVRQTPIGDEGGDSAPLAPLAQNPASALNQVVVEVTILLNSVLDQANRGVNLFDGLRVLYGYTNTLSQISGSLGRESTRTITSQISTPQLDYSLNLFNDSGQYYSVVARPSITAHLGRESQFFAGRTLNVAVSGINLGQLQPIDVGVQLKVTPEFIDDKRVVFNLDAARSFLSQDQIGNFDSSLTTFRQSVSATADVEFGQTLVLSALSEQVNDKSFSKVPGVGDVPVANWFTKRSTDLRRQESLIILVTPTLPLNISTPDTPESREQSVNQLLALWNQRIEPTSDIPAIIRRLKQSRWLRAPESGDLRTRLPQAAQWRREAIEESLLLAKR